MLGQQLHMSSCNRLLCVYVCACEGIMCGWMRDDGEDGVGVIYIKCTSNFPRTLSILSRSIFFLNLNIFIA